MLLLTTSIIVIIIWIIIIVIIVVIIIIIKAGKTLHRYMSINCDIAELKIAKYQNQPVILEKLLKNVNITVKEHLQF